MWQNRRLGEHAPPWDPGGQHSPNTLFAAALAQGGFSLQMPSPQLYYQLLPAHHVKIHKQRGVKIRGLWYDGPALTDHRGRLSARGGARQGSWVIRRDPRDRRFVYFQDPTTPDVWHTLRWIGLPPDGEVPSFGDARVDELLADARARGLAPKSDIELLPLLLELLGGHTPVHQWPTQKTKLTKRKRTEHAREVAQADAVRVDRPTVDPVAAATEADDETASTLRWADRARDVEHEVDAERRRRREHAVRHAPTPPARLGESVRRHSLLLVPDDDQGSSSRKGARR